MKLMIESEKFAEILAEIPELVLGHDTARFNEREYADSLEEYKNQYVPILRKLEECCDAAQDEREELISRACAAILDALGNDIKDPEKYRGWNSRALQLDTYKMVIITYMTPAVFKMGLGISEAFNHRFHDLWLERYPKQPYEVVTEQQIAAGFGRRWYQCYITQAVCQYLGREDDCYELTAFRNFRDTYLRACPDGSRLIEEYYRDAPAIVTRIELFGIGREVYPGLWKEYLEPCLKDIENERLESCRDRYIKMVRKLQEKFLFR